MAGSSALWHFVYHRPQPVNRLVRKSNGPTRLLTAASLVEERIACRTTPPRSPYGEPASAAPWCKAPWCTVPWWMIVSTMTLRCGSSAPHQTASTSWLRWHLRYRRPVHCLSVSTRKPSGPRSSPRADTRASDLWSAGVAKALPTQVEGVEGSPGPPRPRTARSSSATRGTRRVSLSRDIPVDETLQSRSPVVQLQALRPRTLTAQAYEALRRAVAEMPVYDGRHDGHLDERALAAGLGISRTPVREALLRLEHEGIIRTVPRRGVFVVRKSKEEIIEIILASAALESMAARLAATRATDSELASLRAEFLQFTSNQPGTSSRRPSTADLPDGPVRLARAPQDLKRAMKSPRSANRARSKALTPTVRSSLSDGVDPDVAQIAIDEYSEMNVEFHQRIVDLARSELFSQEVARLQVHMRAIRHSTMADSGRLARSVVDHTHIVEALEARRVDEVERYVRQHAIDLAEHVREHLHHLD